MNLKWMIRRFRSRFCIYGSFLATILLLSILYFKDDNYDDIFNQQQENGPFDGPPYFFIVPELRVLTLRTACAIEAAAFHHPQSQVRVYTLSGAKDFQRTYKIFENISNINIQSISISQVFNNTPLQGLFQDQMTWNLKNSLVFTNALVLALISKYGGVYLSNDMWCLNTISDFHNLLFVDKENYTFSAAILFDRWHRLPTLAMKNLRNMLDNKYESTKDIFRLVLKDFCVFNYDDLRVLSNYPVDKCAFKRFVLSPDLIFPRSMEDRKILFTKKSIEVINSYALVKLWDNLTRKVKVRPGSGLVLDNLAHRNCNNVYKAMKRQGHV